MEKNPTTKNVQALIDELRNREKIEQIFH